MIKIGIELIIKPNSGGSYQYWYTILNALSSLDSSKYKVYTIYNDDAWDEVVSHFIFSISIIAVSLLVKSEIGSISEETIEMIQSWKEYCDERGAKLVIAGYPIVRTLDMPDGEDFDEFGIMLEKKTGCNTISKFSDYIIEPELLYDSLYHLTLEGADYRSGLLAKDIKRYLNQ